MPIFTVFTAGNMTGVDKTNGRFRLSKDVLGGPQFRLFLRQFLIHTNAVSRQVDFELRYRNPADTDEQPIMLSGSGESASANSLPTVPTNPDGTPWDVVLVTTNVTGPEKVWMTLDWGIIPVTGPDVEPPEAIE